jgi:hypothetical protein
MVQLTLDDIIKHYWDLEEKIQSAAFLDAVELLSETHEIAGNQITIDGIRLRLNFECVAIERMLMVTMIPITNTKEELAHESAQLSCVGQITKIQISFPAQFRHVADAVLSSMTKMLTAQYEILGIAFLQGYRKFETAPLEGIPAILRAGFAAESPTTLDKRVHLTITAISTKEYILSIGYDQLNYALDHFKRHQSPHFTPLEGAISLVTEISIDSFITMGILNSSEFTVLDFDDIFEIEGLTGLTMAQNSLFGSEKLATIELCRTEALSLQLCCTIGVISKVSRVIDLVRKDIADRFEANTSGWSKERSQLAVNWRNAQKQKGKIGRAVREFVLDFLAKLGAEIARGGSS